MTELQKIVVPDIGGVSSVDVIELLVKPGDHIEKDTPLITLESDKASMEIPSPVSGIVSSLNVKVGDKIGEGDLILMYKGASDVKVSEVKDEAKPTPDSLDIKSESIKNENSTAHVTAPIADVVQTSKPIEENSSMDGSMVLAGPSARRLAHTLGVDLAKVFGTGRKSRVSKEDVEQYVKNTLSKTSSHSGFSLPQAKTIDFSRFGDVEIKPLNKIKRLTGVSVHNSWITIPHVTQFDTADITDLEAFRKSEIERNKEPGYKLTILAFVLKVVCKALKEFPQFNSSLDVSGQNLIYKNYFNIGIAVETPNGLVVPVINNVDKLSVSGIALEMGRLSSKARDKGLMPADMAGGCFTISSLGGIGGHAFTPIVNSPEVAILGLSKSSIQPVFQDGTFKPRLILPLSLSYDHRVIDGAEAARFTRYISECLSDLRRVII